MIRFVLLVLVVIIDFIVIIPFEIIGYAIGLFSMKARNAYMKVLMTVVLSVLQFLSGASVKFIGMEKIPQDRAVLYVANHQSFFDVILTITRLPGLVCFVAKKQFKKIPIFYQGLDLYNTLFIDRDNVKEGLKTILEAIERIKGGMSVFIFPEGTRSRDGNMNEFKEGSMKIATKSGCPIVPVAITNTAEVFENHFPKVRGVPVIVEMLDPIYPEDFDKTEQKHLGKLCKERIEAARDINYEKYCK